MMQVLALLNRSDFFIIFLILSSSPKGIWVHICKALEHQAKNKKISQGICGKSITTPTCIQEFIGFRPKRFTRAYDTDAHSEAYREAGLTLKPAMLMSMRSSPSLVPLGAIWFRRWKYALESYKIHKDYYYYYY